jgi:hypothetical protein
VRVGSTPQPLRKAHPASCSFWCVCNAGSCGNNYTLSTAASRGTPPVPVTTHLTPASLAEVILAPTTATPRGFRFDVFSSLGIPRSEEPQRGGHEGSAAEL